MHMFAPRHRTRFVSCCLLCGARADAMPNLCRGCIGDLPRNRTCCSRCALPLPHATLQCGRCLRRPPPWQSAWVPYRYAWPLDRLETRYKFSARLAAGRALARLWLMHPPPETADAIVPVPLHDRRLRQRGYDQALELARHVARHMHLPLCADALVRARPTDTQSTLDARARRRNVRHAFRLREGANLPVHVALFDDVMTTGATLAACASVLRRAGVERVDVWALARVDKPDGRTRPTPTSGLF